MDKTIKPGDLGAAVQRELETYHEDILRKMNAAGDEAVKAVVKKTKSAAPKQTGLFKKNIASKLLEKGPRGNTYVWYVKAPYHRLTHLLVHGHAKADGGRVEGDPFLANALDEVLPDYEKAVEEAITND